VFQLYHDKKKLHSAGRHVAPLGHIIPIRGQLVFVLTP